MYLHNTTFVVADTAIGWWAGWMQRHYLPTFADIVPTAHNELYRLEHSAQSAGSTSYSCQWKCNTLQELGEIDKYSKTLLQKLTAEKGEACLSFVTMMESVEL